MPNQEQKKNQAKLELDNIHLRNGVYQYIRCFFGIGSSRALPL
jgi:hypothetical protein